MKKGGEDLKKTNWGTKNLIKKKENLRFYLSKKPFLKVKNNLCWFK